MKRELSTILSVATVVVLLYGFTTAAFPKYESMGSGSSHAITHTSDKTYSFGDVIDNLDGVLVHYNGDPETVRGRTITADGYNLGLRYQCVEFVKRYYFLMHNHKMPSDKGNAHNFFDEAYASGALNEDRNLFQYTNGSETKPRKGDILVFQATEENPYGHVGLVSNVNEDNIEMIHQNGGVEVSPRKTYKLINYRDHWIVGDNNLKGWLSIY